MRRHRHLFVLAFSCMLGISGQAYAQGLSELPRLIGQLSLEDEDAVCSALEKMGRICDESCVPFVADALRHHEPRVVMAACRTAQALANPRLALPLFEIVRNHPLDEVRVAALKALTRLQREGDYESLLMTVGAENSGDLQKRIIRVLPESVGIREVKHYAGLARTHALSSSVAAAYRAQPMCLLETLLDDLSGAQSEADSRNILRTMRLLLDGADRDAPISPRNVGLLWGYPEFVEEIAPVEARLGTPDAVRFLLTYLDRLSAPVMLDVLHALRGEAAEMFSDAVIESGSYSRFMADPALKRAFFRLKNTSAHARELAFSLWRDRETAADGLRMLGAFSEDPDVRAIVLRALGAGGAVSLQAMHIAASSPLYWPDLVQIVSAHSADDHLGISYYARWAMVEHVRQYPGLDTDAACAEALGVWRDPKRFHAEPALWLMQAASCLPDMISAAQFAGLRPDMKCAYLRAFAAHLPPELVSAALRDRDQAVASQMLRLLPGRGDADSLLPDALLLQMLDTPLVIQAAVTAGLLGRTVCLEKLQSLLTHPDVRVAYNALWGLQKMHALPNRDWLKALYYRAPDGVLRDRLKFLAGFAPENEHLPMSELSTHQVLEPGQTLQIVDRDKPAAHQNVSIMLEDQSLLDTQTNVFGMIFL
ncbi:MAG: HEAT repeat domain-containing protein [Proteobacteria bacterium]|nr:HEAT repeat domain-containing protein [Pseudomonadota bacterium]